MKKNIFKTTIVIFVILISGISCNSKTLKKNNVTPKINVENEKICISKLSGLNTLKKWKYWPKDTVESNVLINNFSTLEHKITAEFRNCEKYGLFKVVDSLQSPTVYVNISLKFNSFSNDTLYIPFKMEVIHKIYKKKYVAEFKYATLSNNTLSDTTNQFHKVVDIISDYITNFNVKEITSYFYSENFNIE